MSIYDLDQKTPGVTLYRHPKPKVVFDEDCMPVDNTPGGRPGAKVLMDWDLFEEMLIDGKFRTKHEAVEYVRNVYTLLYDPDDEDTHWTDSSWERVRRGLFPEARAALAALPTNDYGPREPTQTEWGIRLLKDGKCRNDHEIKSEADLGTLGRDANGKHRLACIHCRRERSRRFREKKKGN